MKRFWMAGLSQAPHFCGGPFANCTPASPANMCSAQTDQLTSSIHCSIRKFRNSTMLASLRRDDVRAEVGHIVLDSVEAHLGIHLRKYDQTS